MAVGPMNIVRATLLLVTLFSEVESTPITRIPTSSPTLSPTANPTPAPVPTVTVRVEFTTCNSSNAGSSDVFFLVDFPSVPFTRPQNLTFPFQDSYSTYNQVYFMLEYPSDLRIFSRSEDDLCISSMVVNDVVVPFPDGDIWLGPCLNATNNTSLYNDTVCSRNYYTWNYGTVDSGIPPVGVHVEFEVCDVAGASSPSTAFFVDFPSVSSFAGEYISTPFNIVGGVFTQDYGMDTLPTDIRISAESDDGLCFSGIKINNMSIEFEYDGIWLDNPCLSTFDYGDGGCATEFMWTFGADQIESYNCVYAYYHTCRQDDSDSRHTSYLTSFPSVPSFSGSYLESAPKYKNVWYYQMYVLSSYPTDIQVDAESRNNLCLDDVRINDDSMLEDVGHVVWLDNPCHMGKNYSNYCYTSLVLPNVSLSSSQEYHENELHPPNWRFLKVGVSIVFVGIAIISLVGFITYWCYIAIPSTRTMLGKEEDAMIEMQQNGVNPLQKVKGQMKVEITFNKSDTTEQEMNDVLDEVTKVALAQVARLAENDNDFLIAKLGFKAKTNKIVKLVELLLMVSAIVCCSLTTVTNFFNMLNFFIDIGHINFTSSCSMCSLGLQNVHFCVLHYFCNDNHSTNPSLPCANASRATSTPSYYI
jgi:hypothetical protein